MIKHRNDIDGLRAIAVGAVVLYHCGFARHFPGGFVGVDIFFVISGFLITGIVQSDIVKGRFSILDFYNRRARRIFPALVLVYVAIFAASFATMMPSEVALTTHNILSSLFFFSNIMFYSQAGYFDTASEFNVVLHTWSLSVEEQFYIVLPILLYVLRGLGTRRLMILLAVAAVVSLVASQWMLGPDPSASFYLVQYRAWELLFGSLLALGALPSTSNTVVNNALGVAGLALIGGSIFLMSTATPFPGISALPVCIGTVLLIYSGMGSVTFVSRLLSLPPVRMIGLISYSLYLWHWPVWVFGSQIIEPKSLPVKLLFIAISVVLAYISWRFIEAPFRKRPYATGPGKTVAYTGVAMAAVAVIAVAMPLAAQSFWRVPPRVEEIARFFRYDPQAAFRSGSCFLEGNAQKFDPGKCLEISSTKPNYVLLGDSHAAHLYAGLSANKAVNVLQATASGCKPIIGTTGEDRCTHLMAMMFKDFLPKHHFDAIVISARWKDEDIPGLLEAIKQLKPYASRIVVSGPIVEYDMALPRILAKAVYDNDPALTAKHRLTTQPGIDVKLRDAVAPTGVKYVSMYDAVCPNKDCTVWAAENEPLQFDYGHLTADGSRLAIARVGADIFGADHDKLAAQLTK